MEYLFFAIGILFGSLATSTLILLHNKRTHALGFFLIDEQSNLCEVKTASEDLQNTKIKKVVLTVKRGVNLSSREEQVL